MKRFIALAVVAFLVACGGGATPSNTTNTGNLNLSGTIQGWSSTLGSTVVATTLTDEIIGQGSVDAAGNFGIQLSPPATLRSTPIGGCNTTLGPDVVVTPSTLRMNNAFLLAGTGATAPFIFLGDAPSGRYNVTYMYANEAGTVGGTDACTLSYFYNMTLQEGWNIVIAEFVRDTSGRPSEISYRAYPLGTDLSGYRYFVTSF